MSLHQEVAESHENEPTNDNSHIPPAKFKDFLTYHVVSFLIQDHLNYNNVSESHKVFLSSITDEPNTFREAIAQPIWKKAMTEELSALDSNHTWDIVKLPKGKKVVGCRWIYKTRYNSDGTVERHKARLVRNARVHSNIRSRLMETFALVVRRVLFECYSMLL